LGGDEVLNVEEFVGVGFGGVFVEVDLVDCWAGDEQVAVLGD
jgi:hypothetical protein